MKKIGKVIHISLRFGIFFTVFGAEEKHSIQSGRQVTLKN